MYYPYFRGKQNELILLREEASLIKSSNFCPIIEPVKHDFRALAKCFNELDKMGARYILILNPKIGESPVSQTSIERELESGLLSELKNIELGYILEPDEDLVLLIQTLKQQKNRKFHLVHSGYTDADKLLKSVKDGSSISSHIFLDKSLSKLYLRKFNGKHRILIRNGFKPRKKNADYLPQEHFSDLHLTYEDENMNGFGDYTIVGEEYSESGGPAYAVAIHLTYIDPDKDNDMFIYHFVSDNTKSPTDPGGKFFESLQKLVQAIGDPKMKILETRASAEFLSLYKREHYPGLGVVKKLSMQHHLELMATQACENEI